MEFRKTFRMELDDYISFNLFHAKKLLLMNILLFIVFVPVLTLLISDSQDYLLVLSVAIFFGIIMASLLTLLNVFLIKRNSKKQYFSTKVMQADTEIIVDGSGIRQTNEFGKLTISWADVFKVIESKKGFYLYISKMQAFVIPKRLVSPEEEKILRGLIDVNLPTKKNRLKTDNINVAI